MASIKISGRLTPPRRPARSIRVSLLHDVRRGNRVASEREISLSRRIQTRRRSPTTLPHSARGPGCKITSSHQVFSSFLDAADSTQVPNNPAGRCILRRLSPGRPSCTGQVKGPRGQGQGAGAAAPRSPWASCRSDARCVTFVTSRPRAPARQWDATAG